MTKRKYQQKKSKKNKKRKSNNSGANGNKRQRLPGDDSEGETKSSESSPVIPLPIIMNESDVDRRGREKKERKQKKLEEAAERKRQGHAKMAANQSKSCFANIGGERVEKNGIMTFEGGQTFGKWTKQEAEEATGCSKGTIKQNIHRKIKSSGKKGEFEGQKVMFINAPDDTSDKVPCGVCGNHYGSRNAMINHVRAKHPEVPLPPVRKYNKMPEEYKTFTPPITQKQYSFIVEKVGDNIRDDLKKCDQKQLMALVEGYEPWGSANINKAGEKYNLTEQQILDSIANNEPLIIEEGKHSLQLGRGRTKDIRLAGRTVTFSWKYRVSEEDKIKLTKMNNKETRLETYHMIARQYCEHMNKEGMFAKKNVTDDNGGLLKNCFEFESHGGLFAISFDRIEDNYTVNGQTFHKLHYPDPENALENIHVVALMANVPYKASTKMIQDRYDIYKNKSEEQQKEEFKKVLEISNKKTQNGKETALYAHARRTWNHDNNCKGAFPDTPTEKGFRAYWQHMLVLLKKQKGLCAVAKIPMSLERGPWKISCDAIKPRLGHVPDNIRLICLYNNVTDFSKLNKDLTDTRPHSLNTVLHDEYWRIVRE